MSFQEFTTMVTDHYKDDLEKIARWKAIYTIFDGKWFRSKEDCKKEAVADFVKDRKRHKDVLEFIMNEGINLKTALPKAITALAKALETNPERRAEIRFMFYFLKFEKELDDGAATRFNKVLRIKNPTLFENKGCNQAIHLELKKMYCMLKDNSVPSKNQKTSKNNRFPVEAVIMDLMEDLTQSQESYENLTFYNKKYKSMIDLMKKLKQKLEISEKQIQMLESECNDKSLFVPYGMGFSPLVELVEGDATKFGWVRSEPEDRINELTQGQPKPSDSSDSDGSSDDDDGDSDGDDDGDDNKKTTDQLTRKLLENIESHKSRDSNGNGGDDEEFPNTQERNARIKQQEEEDRSVAEAVAARDGEWDQYGSSVSVDKGFNSDSTDDDYSSDEGDPKSVAV